MTTVFIAGCFDGLHIAHLSILQRARALGDRLIVGLNSDAHLARKGPGRPLDTWRIRAQKLVDTGLVYSVSEIEDSPLDMILECQPDIIAVGSDYTMDTTVGAKECASWGGKVVILPRTPGISTTQLIDERLRQHVRDNLDIDPSQR
jgi:rfaE bifunctional protein nucleotidyltransferase chain/domain